MTTDHADTALAEHAPSNPFAQGASALAVRDTSAAKQAQSREMAEMQTKFLMAQHFPRDERRAMDGVLNAFSRPGLAEVAQYEYAKGGSKISGLSVHALQAIAQQWGNIEFGWSEVSRGVGTDGVAFSEIRALAVDLQSRTMRPLQFIVRHWRDTKQGGYKLKDEREVYELCANMAQRRVRSCLEAVIPRDVQDAAEQQANVTLTTKADTSPEAMHKMLDAFAHFGVTKEQIEKRIQRRLDAITPAQVVGLKRIYASLRDEISTAAEWFEQPATGEATATSSEPVPATPAGKAKDALRARQAGGKAKDAAVPAPDIASVKLAIDNAGDADTAALVLDQARDSLSSEDMRQLSEHLKQRWEQ